MAATAKARVTFVELKPWERDFVEERAEAADWEVRSFEAPAGQLPEAEKSGLEVLSCFIRSDVDAAWLDQCPHLKLIATRSTGYDHIDLAECQARSVTVCNVSAYGENTVAEHTFGLILALSRNLYPAVDRMKRGDVSIEGLCGFDLYGKTL
jgi:D-lactate dehydrogenase